MSRKRENNIITKKNENSLWLPFDRLFFGLCWCKNNIFLQRKLTIRGHYESLLLQVRYKCFNIKIFCPIKQTFWIMMLFSHLQDVIMMTIKTSWNNGFRLAFFLLNFADRPCFGLLDRCFVLLAAFLFVSLLTYVFPVSLPLFFLMHPNDWFVSEWLDEVGIGQSRPWKDTLSCIHGVGQRMW